MHNHSKLKPSIANYKLGNNGAEVIELPSNRNKAHELAYQRCIETLLNCFYREGLASGNCRSIQSAKELENSNVKVPGSLSKHKYFMYLDITSINAAILISVKYSSKMGFCHYQSAPYLKTSSTIWKVLTWHELTVVLLKEFAKRFEQPFNYELLGQIENSVQVMADLIDFNMRFITGKSKEHNFIESEQSLLLGHSFHPSPKCREGFTQQDLYEFSPESQAKFPLYYFLVRKDFVIGKSVLKESAIELIQKQAPRNLPGKDNYVLVCIHPWQAHYLKQLSILDHAIKQGYLYDLGQHGEEYYPTSSIRTLYHPDNPFFYKFSLNIRITNCVRKNTIHELENALCLTKILFTKLDEIKEKFPDFHILLEPAYLSLDLPSNSEDEKLKVIEGFGMIFRQSFPQEQLNKATPILAGALFSKPLLGNLNIFENIKELANNLKVDYELAATTWFDQYVEKLLYPMLYCHFNLGITFEPHLQNVLIGIKDNMPLYVVIRDLEAAELNPEYWPPEKLAELNAELDERAKKSVYYAKQLGWKCITYCLLANNFAEAIFHIADANEKLETKLWSIVQYHLRLFQEKYGNESSGKRIYGLLSTDPLPIKDNFATRFLKKADVAAPYYQLKDHPLQEKGRLNNFKSSEFKE